MEEEAVAVVVGFVDLGLGGSTCSFRARRVQESQGIARILGRGLKGRRQRVWWQGSVFK